MENVTERVSNPFDMRLPCDRAVPGYGDANGLFHVVGDHPGVHGGVDSGIPFTDAPGTDRLQRALADAGLLENTGTPPTVNRTFFSYLHACVAEAGEPTAEDYTALEPFFDAELRAITAHVLVPVGDRAIRHILREYTARTVPDDPSSLHATEVRGSGFLVYPVADPTTWTDADGQALVTALQGLQREDFRREADLGRFLPGDDPYHVR